MSERRGVVAGLCRSISVTLFLLTVTAAPCASAPALYGLVIGIDDYVGTANDLDGAVNDANDISRAIARLGAGEVVRLFNDEASKERIAAEWKRLVGQARAGDTIIFTYAGHGSQADRR